MNIGNYVIPITIASIIGYGLYKNADVFGVFVDGAKEGISTSFNILPSLIALITCVGMFRACGLLDVITHYLAPVAALFKIPREIIPLAVLRPISGSAAMVFFNNILTQFGPDSFIGRVASVLEGSSETTFYTIAVYYGAVKIRGTRHTVTASLIADLAGFVMSAVMVTLLFGSG